MVGCIQYMRPQSLPIQHYPIATCFIATPNTVEMIIYLPYKLVAAPHYLIAPKHFRQSWQRIEG